MSNFTFDQNIDPTGGGQRGTTDIPVAFTTYRNGGGTLTLDQWLAAGQPAAPVTTTPPAEPPPTTPPPRTGGPIPEGFNLGGLSGDFADQLAADATAFGIYRDTGGTLGFGEWISAGRPGHQAATGTDFTGAIPGDITVPGQLPAGDTTGDTTGVITQNPDGTFSHPLNETIWLTEADAIADYNTTLQSQGFQETLTGQLATAREEDVRVSAEREAEATRLSARQTGRLEREVRNALLAQGRSAGEIEQLTASGIEGGQRSLSDLLTQLDLSAQAQSAARSRFEISTSLTAEGLAQGGRQIAAQGSQFGQSLAEQVRQFTQRQEQQAGQFAQGFGLDQQQLAEQIRQFNLTRGDTQSGALASGLGRLFGTVAGGAAGFVFGGGPAGVIPGAAVGGNIFSG